MSGMTKAWDRSFWRGRRVLLTGHTGFKGAWLAAWLQRLGASVTGFSLPAPAYESPAWQSLGPQLVAQGLADLRGDVRDCAGLASAIRQARPEMVLHLAAQAIVLDSYRAPELTWETNVMGSLYLLQALAAHGLPVTFVGITSDKCYENREWTWGYRESDPLGGNDPYSASKAACEILLASWRRSFSQTHAIRVASARAGNVIGGGDGAAHRIVPDLLRAFTAGEPAVVRHPKSTRPYQHVLEPLSGYLLLARCLHEEPGGHLAQAYNFGPDADGEKTTGWLAHAAAQCWGDGARVVTQPATSAAHEAAALMLDSARARKELGWVPTWNAGQAVAAAVDWHKAWLAGNARVQHETQRQIDLYEASQPYA